jgi:hypothetical protein
MIKLGPQFCQFSLTPKGKFGPWRGLRDIIREVTALIMSACSHIDCAIKNEGLIIVFISCMI